MPDLLFELGTEEIPAAYMPGAIEHLRKDATERLKTIGLATKNVIATGTPRRLVLFVEDLPMAQPARTEELLGPPEKAAYKDGQPTQAVKGFVEKNGLKLEDVVIKDTAKGRYVTAQKQIEGRRTSELLPELLQTLVKAIPFAKSMRWPQAPGTTFPRPIRRVLALFGREPLSLEIAGCKAGRTTVGHPFLTGDRELLLDKASFGDLRALLRSHFVVVDRNERRSMIEKDLEEAFKPHGAALSHQALLEEVTDLVELPEVVLGTFDEKYLALPPEVVEAAMTDHQRYFPLRAGGKLLSKFAFVMNRPKDHAATVREGNERVLRARLEDASFYLAEDLKTPLRARAGKLAGLLFQEKLGTMQAKSARVAALAGHVADLFKIGHAEGKAAAIEAASLAKTDLTTELVKEFPQLQGAIGAKYAAVQGHAPEVADAIREQYMPKGASDELPRTKAGLVLSVAERLDNLVGFFGIGLAPTGSTDPYALRRQAAGLARLVVESGGTVSLESLVAKAVEGYASSGGVTLAPGTTDGVTTFVLERVKQSLLDQGYRYDIIDAVIAAGANDLVDLRRRLDATVAISKEPFFQDLIEIVERTFNISKKLTTEKAVDAALLTESAEKALAEAWRSADAAVRAAIEGKDFLGAARAYVETLKAPVADFMSSVRVEAPDPAVKENRMALLQEIWRGFGRRVADLAKIVEGKKPAEGKK